eukprot:172887-Rhodomonas_salina.2
MKVCKNGECRGGMKGGRGRGGRAGVSESNTLDSGGWTGCDPAKLAEKPGDAGAAVVAVPGVRHAHTGCC